MGQHFTVLPPNQKHRITACVGFITVPNEPNKFVIIKNKRGWDIPGGHVEEDETPVKTFSRELMEETACILGDADLIAVLESHRDHQTGIAVFRGSCSIGQFTPTSEIKDRKFVERDELQQLYYGDKSLLRELMALI